MAGRGGSNFGVGGDWELLGLDPDTAAKAQALANALRGQQSDALAFQALTGGPRALPGIGAQMSQQRQQELAGLGQAAGERLRMAMQQRQFAAQQAHQNAQLAQQQAHQAETERHNRASEALNAQLGGGSLSPEALQAMADQYRRTGVLPQIGAGRAGAGLKVSVANAAAAADPGVDLAGNAANYKADKASLASQQKLLDLTKSWEATGKANLGVLREAAGAMVNAGSPLLNKPVRWLYQNAGGNPAITKFKAAHNAVVNEYAKILSGATGGAGVTDSARREAEGMLPMDATPEQLAAAADVLERDAGNRLGALSSQVAATQQRVSGRQQTSPATTPPSDATSLRAKYGL